MRIMFCIWALAATIAASTVDAQNFGGEVGRWRVTGGSLSADTFKLNQGVPVGTRAVVILGWEAPSTMALSSVTDNKGNTWTIHLVKLSNTVHQCAIASADMASPLVAGDSITIHWSAGQYADRSALLIYLNNVPAGAVSAQNATGNYGTTMSAPLTIPDTSAIVIGLVQIEQDGIYSGCLGTMIGSRVTYGDSASTVGLANYVFYKDGPFSGSFNPKGTFNINKSYETLQVAFKVGAIAQRVAPPSNLRVVAAP